MNIKRLLILSFFCANCSSVSAQSPLVQGYIYDSQSRYPLAGASITDINSHPILYFLPIGDGAKP